MNLSFDDVLISPQFSTVASRKDVQLTTDLGLLLPVISSNMDSVTGPAMAKAMQNAGAQACLHRFQSIEDNVSQFQESGKPWVSLGLGDKELERAEALYQAGATTFVIDVAHGASMSVVNQTKELRKLIHGSIIIGNFATAQSVKDFLHHLGDENVAAIKVGIGGGSACTTRVVTGCGMPTFSSIVDCADLGIPIIADGGIRNSGDVAKSLAAGASAVMLGRMLAGSEESPGNTSYKRLDMWPGIDIQPGDKIFVPNGQKPYSKGSIIDRPVAKQYRGSASAESYKAQGKEASHRTAEGESMLVPYTGPVASTLQQIEAGIRSSMSYVGAHTIKEFQQKAKFIQISNSGIIESRAHGKA